MRGGGWRGSEALRHWRLLQRTQVWSQHPHGDPQRPTTPVPERLAPSSGLLGHQVHTWDTGVQAGKHPDKIRNKTTPNDRLQKARETQRHGACLSQEGRWQGPWPERWVSGWQVGQRGCQHRYRVAVGGRPAPVCRETLRHRRAAREVPCALPCPLHRGGRDTAALQAWSVAAHTHTKCPRAEGAQVTREGSPAREPGYVTHRGQEQTQEASECRARLSYAD